ncbi:hypothetical protein F4679DRAFT_590267 [Xylaria curta]|nr:hypothetical protein F4679DRAFT_590267 [Xylaria curta]
MTTASSLSLLGAIRCCYNGYQLETQFGYYCLANLTEGSFIIPNSNLRRPPSTVAFGPSQTDSFNSIASHYWGVIYTGRPTIFASALAVFLVGQNLAVTSGSTPATPAGTTSSSQTSSQGLESGRPKDATSKSKTLRIGIAVGVLVGGVLLLYLGLFWFMVYRKRLRSKKRLRVENEAVNKQHQEEYRGKPELEGSAGDPFRLVKAELDALAIRAELEGTAGDEAGTGINVIKPELEGSLGKQSLLGVYVKRKAELEAPVVVHGTANSGK